ncbi:hypothetical protein JX266_006447 [Neoarthrinium moseri]|uniref:uncharacterized protein n=1 Tax=Neoarthrinium moseri TaxID=1658444 RepID=UPI001FDD7910|nr:uncharacterized protein JN550_007048 [Neoarthrinium moseri]KAI1847595.1 hypothetical protein JX266_006447 [Neoarthrinium moseri]KAI1867317.1 hypothetical protein JN550_007048 [Neoarthrinium moseri]
MDSEYKDPLLSPRASSDDGTRAVEHNPSYTQNPAMDSGRTSRQLHPSMVHRPLTPPGHNYPEDGGHKADWNISLTPILRGVVIALAFGIVMSDIPSRSPFHAALARLIFDFFVLVWNIIAVLPLPRLRRAGFRGSRVLQCSVALGPYKCSCGGDEDNDSDDGGDEEGLYDIYVAPRKPERWVRVTAALIDLGLGLALLSTTAADVAESRYYRTRQGPPIIVLHFFFSLIPLLIAMIQVLNVWRGTVVSVRVAAGSGTDDGHEYRIRLPRDDSEQPDETDNLMSASA